MYNKTLLYVTIAVVCHVIILTTTTEIHVVLFLSKNRKGILGNRILPAFEIARETIFSRVETGEYFNFSLQYIHSVKGCENPKKSAVGYAARSFFKKGTMTFFGPTCSASMLGVADLAAYLNAAVFSGSASSHDLDDKARFPTMTQTVFKTSTMVSFMRELFHLFDWKSCVLIVGGKSLNIFTADAIEVGLRGIGVRSYNIHLAAENFDHILQEASVISQSEYGNKMF